uniref:Uncharacterized protein n=1 Tax=Aegilops tauschii TaxID=37682 RepID=M8B1V4_AEGTA
MAVSKLGPAAAFLARILLLLLVVAQVAVGGPNIGLIPGSPACPHTCTNPQQSYTRSCLYADHCSPRVMCSVGVKCGTSLKPASTGGWLQIDCL